MNVTCNNKAQPIVNNPVDEDDQEYAENRIILSDCAGEVDCDFVCCSDCFDRYGVSTTNFCDQLSGGEAENNLKCLSSRLSRGMLILQQNVVGQSFGKIQ